MEDEKVDGGQGTALLPDDDQVSEEAPYGWMTDPKTGDRRPRKRPGRRGKGVQPPVGKAPTVEELQQLGSLPEPVEDVAPGTPKKGVKAPRVEAPLPPFRAGVIAKGVNKLYRKAGRIIRVFDYDIGSAVIASATKDPDAEADDDTTVGEAWENLAKTNPRIRAFLLRAIQGGAWTTLFETHMPILLAIALKDGIRRRIPLLKLADAFLLDNDDNDAPSDLSQAMGGINPQDMAQMMQMAQAMMGDVANNMPRTPNMPYRGPSDTHPSYEPTIKPQD